MSKGPWKSPDVCRCGRCRKCRNREACASYYERGGRDPKVREEFERIDAMIASENASQERAA